MDGHSKSQVKRLVAQSPEYAAGFKAGREAGMREASGIVQPSYNQCRDEREIAHALQMKADAILSAIGGGK